MAVSSTLNIIRVIGGHHPAIDRRRYFVKFTSSKILPDSLTLVYANEVRRCRSFRLDMARTLAARSSISYEVPNESGRCTGCPRRILRYAFLDRKGPSEIERVLRRGVGWKSSGT